MFSSLQMEFTQTNHSPSVLSFDGCADPSEGVSSWGGDLPNIKRDVKKHDIISKSKKQLIDDELLRAKYQRKIKILNRQKQQRLDDKLLALYTGPSPLQQEFSDTVNGILRLLVQAEKQEQDAIRQQLSLVMQLINESRSCQEHQHPGDGFHPHECRRRYPSTRPFQKKSFYRHSGACIFTNGNQSFQDKALQRLYRLVNKLHRNQDDGASQTMRQSFNDTLSTNTYSKRTLRIVHRSRLMGLRRVQQSLLRKDWLSASVPQSTALYRAIESVRCEQAEEQAQTYIPQTHNNPFTQHQEIPKDVHMAKNSNNMNTHYQDDTTLNAFSIVKQQIESLPQQEPHAIKAGTLMHQSHIVSNVITTNSLRKQLNCLMKCLKNSNKWEGEHNQWRHDLKGMITRLVADWRSILKSKKQDANQQLLLTDAHSLDCQTISIEEVLDPLSKNTISKKEKMITMPQNALSTFQAKRNSVAFLVAQLNDLQMTISSCIHVVERIAHCALVEQFEPKLAQLLCLEMITRNASCSLAKEKQNSDQSMKLRSVKVQDKGWVVNARQYAYQQVLEQLENSYGYVLRGSKVIPSTIRAAAEWIKKIPQTIKEMLQLEAKSQDPKYIMLFGHCNVAQILSTRAFLLEDVDCRHVEYDKSLQVTFSKHNRGRMLKMIKHTEEKCNNDERVEVDNPSPTHQSNDLPESIQSTMQGRDEEGSRSRTAIEMCKDQERELDQLTIEIENKNPIQQELALPPEQHQH
ncbi:hypothetical protein OXYTRIMIC_231 [Oxytricha trifallax]|uniref:Uncharacterized protein n=1 Tax=Oxytricha trifallax TaxID=1172189 RepID=A0A073HY52_9SPIT|nr:hypothetical protein OXYTRIMIC_231 [Oxytricha trifallax]